MRRWFLVAAALVGCERTPTPQPDPAASVAAASKLPARAVTFKRATSGGSIPEQVQRERAEAQASGQRLVVYVGATWCEPCQRFHHAAEEGKLEGQLPPVRFLEFDLDRDGDQLKAAGYRSRYIPLFALPGDDGRGRSPDQQIEGGVKGDGAVGHITPRLRKLLGVSPLCIEVPYIPGAPSMCTGCLRGWCGSTRRPTTTRPAAPRCW